MLRVREQRNVGDTVIATHEPLSSSLPEMRLHNIKRRLSRRAQLLNLRLGKIREAMRRPIGSKLPFRLGTQVSTSWTWNHAFPVGGTNQERLMRELLEEHPLQHLRTLKLVVR